jgi:DNA-binding transcriptional ArsR family regulator
MVATHSKSVPRRDRVFHSIADPSRRRILEMLAQGERPVGRIAEHFAMSRPAVIKHLRVLRAANLINASGACTSWLDRAPKGRNEETGGVWWRRHDEYDKR